MTLFIVWIIITCLLFAILVHGILSLMKTIEEMDEENELLWQENDALKKKLHRQRTN